MNCEIFLLFQGESRGVGSAVPASRAINLRKLKKNWESLAERDALGAILTDRSKIGGKWDRREFMATGEAEIEVVMGHLERIGHLPDFLGTALDFGCGVGRLTQALARRFTTGVGVDISRKMIDKAVEINEFAGCTYVAHSDARLPFTDDTFAFIYSNIVLQHVPPRFSEQYLKEFVRVLAPCGVLVFGVQDSFAMPDIASRLVRIRHVPRLRSRIQDALGRGKGDMQMHCLPKHAVQRASAWPKWLTCNGPTQQQRTSTADSPIWHNLLNPGKSAGSVAL